jgi:hypothetical protein
MNTSDAGLDRVPFAGSSLLEHLLGGVVGLAALWWAIEVSAQRPLTSLALGGAALLAFRGCPVCGTISLFETARRRFRRLQEPSPRDH